MGRSALGAPPSWFSADEQPTLRAVWAACERHGERVVAGALSPCRDGVEPGAALRSWWLPRLRAHRDPLLARLQQGLAGDWGPFSALLAGWGAESSRAGLALADWYSVIDALRRQLTPVLLAAHAGEASQLEARLNAAHKFLDRSMALIAEEYVAERERRLSEQREYTEQALLRFARLSESGLLGIFVCDLEGHAKEANDAFLAMMGYTREELLSGQVSWVEMTPDEWRHLDDDAIVQLKKYGRTAPWEKEYIRKDGTRLPVLVGVAMLGEIDCVAYVLDISERKRLEELRTKSQELEAQNRRILEASRLKSEFLANMSHELRTPLNSIIGFADLLYDGEVQLETPQYRECIGDILKSGRHLLQLINDVLDLAKVESGKMELRPEPVQLSHLIGEVSAILRTVAAGKQIRMEYQVDPSAEQIEIDPGRLKQVLYNYVSNALKFTGAGGSVAIKARPEGTEAVRIEVADSGIGIASCDLGRLFVEFQQLDAGAAKRHAGTGLGLALTKRIVEAMGGSVGVRSAPGQGSTFHAIVPRHAVRSSYGVEPSSFPKPDASAPLVLVVEDDPQDRLFLVQTLGRAGFGVETAASGKDALARCREQTFDAITLDLLLPDLTGLDVLRKLRYDGRNRETPVIVVSVVAEKGIVAGFPVHDYLQKPIDGAQLVAALQRAGVSASAEGEILVVDDDHSALKLMEANLHKLGYDVVCRADGQSALAAAKARAPQAVILDLLMPEVDGFEFLARFRADPAHRATPVIVWTMKDITAEDRRKLDQLAQGVFAKGDGKPLSLLDELRRLLSPA